MTDAGREARGVADEVRAHLGGVGVHVFSDDRARADARRRSARGVEVLDELRPDC